MEEHYDWDTINPHPAHTPAVNLVAIITEELRQSIHGLNTDGTAWATIAHAAHQLELLASEHTQGRTGRIVRINGNLTHDHAIMAERIWRGELS